MGGLLRAAIAGIAIGLMELFLYLHEPNDESVAPLLAPFPAGLLLGRLLRLPRWWLGAALAPFLNIAIIALALRGLTFPDLLDVGVLPTALVFAVIGAGGHMTATALTSRADRMIRYSVIGALVVGFTGMSLSTGAIAEKAREGRLAQSGLPLVVVGSPRYSPVHLAEWYSEWIAGMPSFEIAYDGPDGAKVELYVMAGTAASPRAACTEPVPGVSHRADEIGRCREVAPEVWVRAEAGWTRVFARHGEALVQVASGTVGEAGLLAVLPTLRPATAQELAAIGEG
ncbi:hypothetical protein [Nonomuraea rubra]|uniref:hypothetical protein n=1 Tax=Nonomuraea rubra TaxID=46180 RepID=UPI00341089D0